ncbi:MAG: alpha/beta fold hydrolase [Bacillus sp. (in: firmicutes)]|uniref:alpha/beta hydrolase n=1 Tax=Bacillus marasmi TaxID=1926279 RepID=UPI001FEA6122|nr:alpha/beta fold hydrolase [Bacillus marasmi]
MNMTQEAVITGAESFFLKGNNIGILLSHGFVGTPQSVREVGELLNHYGYTVLAPRLTGHGTSIYDFETAKHTDWLRDLENAYLTLRETCEEIFIVGQSMGGALCLQLAAMYPEIKGVITINAALHVPAYDEYRNEIGPRFIPEGAPDIKDASAVEITYESVPLTAIHELQKVLDKTINSLGLVKNPVLALVSEEDHVVPPSDSDQIIAGVSSKNKAQVVLKNSYHVASLDFDKNLITYYSHIFITKMINN